LNKASTFSIVIVNYNYAHFIEQAIKSALNQNYSSELFEVIVVDDGSTDNSLKIIKKFSKQLNLKIISQKNSGQASAYAAGIKAAKNDWICLLDSDDYYKPEKLNVLNDYLNQHQSDCLFVCSDVDIHYENINKVDNVFTKKTIKADSLNVDQSDGYNYFSNPGGQLYRRDLILSICNLLNYNDWIQGADVPLSWGALFIAGKVNYLHASLAVYRVHDKNHFINSSPGGVPKVDYLERLPKLLTFLEEINKKLSINYLGNFDRSKLLKKIRSRIQSGQVIQPNIKNEESKQLPLITLVTTCKNRLEHLKVSLPKMVIQPNAKVVVVNYGCQQGTSEWVSSNYPQVKLVEVNDDEGWNVSRARNLGARSAESEWLFFIDADAVLKINIVDWLKNQTDQSSLYLPAPKKTNLFGTCIIKTEVFNRLGGYDEAFRGWGGEDTELYDRVISEKLKIKGYPSQYIDVIEHGDEMRAFGNQHDQLNTMNTALRVELLYRTIKRDIKGISGKDLDISVRVKIMQHIKDSVKKYEETQLKEHGQIKIVINDGLSMYQRANFNRTLVYSLRNLEHRIS
jgi:hypothetical protein